MISERPPWSDQLNQQPCWRAHYWITFFQQKSWRGESRTCLKMLTSKGESKFDLLLLTFTWLTSPKFNKVKSMRNTYVTFKCAPNPGSEVKMPSHEIWSLCEPKIVWFLGTWYGLLTSEAVSGGEEHGPSCSGGKAPGACGGYREVTLWGKGGGQGSLGQREHLYIGQHINNHLLIHFNLHKTIIFFSCSNLLGYKWLGF